MINQQLLDLFSKPKQKITILVLGGGMMGGDAVAVVATRGVLDYQSGKVLACAEPRKKSLMNLEKVLATRPCVVLRGHAERGDKEARFLEVQTGSFILDGKGGRMVDPENSVDNLLRRLNERIICHTLDKAREIVLQHKNWSDAFGSRDGMPCEQILPRLLQGLPPALELESVALPAPKRVSLLTDVMKAELLAASPEAKKPLQKIFGGSGTWLLYSMEDDGDTLWGVCDIGQGIVEFGTVSLTELETTRTKLGTPMERDKWFRGCDYSIRELCAMDGIPSVLTRKAVPA